MQKVLILFGGKSHIITETNNLLQDRNLSRLEWDGLRRWYINKNEETMNNKLFISV